MNQSESVVNLAKALVAVQGNLETLQKSADNPYFHSKYTPLDAIWEYIRPILAANGLAVVQFPSQTGLDTMILHTSGEWLSCDSRWGIDASNPQKIGSAITYMRRYGLCATLGIVTTDEDDDGNKASHDSPPPERQKPNPEFKGQRMKRPEDQPDNSPQDSISAGFPDDEVCTKEMVTELLNAANIARVDMKRFEKWLHDEYGCKYENDMLSWQEIKKKDHGPILRAIEKAAKKRGRKPKETG